MEFDLLASRLRWDPSAVRSAVERSSSSYSPTQSARESGWESFIFAQEPSSFKKDPNLDHLTTTSFSDTNPSAMSFTLIRHADSDDQGAVNMSLCNALTAEQDAHAAVKAALHDAENEVTRLRMSNKSLITSIKMLGIIKHNVEKSERNTSSVTLSMPRKYNAFQTSVLHDSLKRRRTEYETQAYSKADVHENETAKNAVVKTCDRGVSGKELFNIDLLQSPNLEDDSETSASSRTLRKSFLDSSEPTDTEKSMPTPWKASDRDQLIDLSPEEQRKPPQAVEMLKSCLTKPNEIEVQKMISDSKSTSVRTEMECSHELAVMPHLSLPRFILKRYSGPKRKLVPTAPQEPEIEVAKISTSKIKKEDSDPSKDDILAAFGASPSEAQQDFPKRLIKVTNMPFSTTIHWNIHANNGVFDDEIDRIISFMFNAASRREYPRFWDHPIRYLPSLAEKNLYRTVMRDFIPLGTTYDEVLEHIHTGAIESIILLPAIGRATTFATARIVFHYSLAARNLYVRDQDHPIYIKDQRIRVYQVLQPTYPKNKQLEYDVFEAKYTRLLLIARIDENQLANIPTKLGRQILAGSVIEIGRSHDNLCLIAFTSVAEAVKAMVKMVRDPEFGGAEFDFEEDPCAAGYRE